MNILQMFGRTSNETKLLRQAYGIITDLPHWYMDPIKVQFITAIEYHGITSHKWSKRVPFLVEENGDIVFVLHYPNSKLRRSLRRAGYINVCPNTWTPTESAKPSVLTHKLENIRCMFKKSFELTEVQ